MRYLGHRRTVASIVAAAAVFGGFASGGAAAVAAPAASHALSAAPTCRANYYENVNGICVHRPDGNSSGATARCRDGSYSHSRHASGTCSGHGGVARWIHHP
jgi:hypothetical protein